MTETMTQETPEKSDVTEKRVAVAAYHKWQNRGSHQGDSLALWVDAYKDWIPPTDLFLKFPSFLR